MWPRFMMATRSGDFQCFLLIVRDENAGHMQFVVQLAQPAAQLLAYFCVERAEGFVEQKNARLNRQGAGQRDALALASTESWLG